MNTRCIIVDDEPLAIKLIRTHVSKFNFLEVVAECKNAIQAVDVLRSESIDLMFLDINMPRITGLDFLKSLPHPPSVIITTAYREFALEGYDLDVVDYLLKPISFDRFLKAINKYCERLEKRSLNKPSSSSKTLDLYIYIQDGKTIHKVYFKDILYLEGYGEYVKVHSSNKVYLSREPMHAYENKLPGDIFLRTHKSYIVSLRKVEAFTSGSVIIRGIELPIGRTFREHVFKTLNFKKE